VEVFDTTFATREALETRLTRETGVLGLYTNLMTRSSILRITRKAKDLGWTVVLGGPESANYPEEYVARGADVVVIGEGEATLADLLPALARGGPHRLENIPGVVFKDESGAFVRNPERPALPSLDALLARPRGHRPSALPRRVAEAPRRGQRQPHHGSRLPYKCNWCSHAVFGFSHRRRSPKNVADEVAFILERYAPEQLWYADDVFTIHHTWLHTYADEIERRGLSRPFETISRADRLMKDDVFEALKRLGCTRVWIGSESGSQRILDAMQRGVTAEQVQWATKAAQRHGIQVGMFLMWGYDGETEDDIEATVEHVKKANPDIFFTTVAYPIKNTGFFQKVADRVVLDQDWENATDRDYRIAGRRSRAYYRKADEWLRNDVAAFRLEASQPEEARLKKEAAIAARAAMRILEAEVEA
jgi:radical SAM superfamily enzyme YgiQ (UPF0313 family)